MRQRELAARLHCTPSAVSLWETGTVLPTTAMLPDLAAALGCSIGELFGEVKEMAKAENIYLNARKSAGLTQERWAEVLGVSVSAVQKYEAGEIMPEEDVVLCMADMSGLQILGTWHLRRKSALAAKALPPIERLPLAQAVVQLIGAIRAFDARHHDDALLRIAADGRVDPEEEARFQSIVRDLDGVVRAALQIDYAEKG